MTKTTARFFVQCALLALCILMQYVLAAAASAAGMNDFRIWKDTTGVAKEARMVTTAGESVVLELRDGKRITVALRMLIEEDRRFVEAALNAPLESLLQPEAPAPPEEQTIADFPAEPGKISAAIACKAAPEWSYFAYLPKSFRKSRQYPVLYVMDPGGGKTGTVQRYVEAAERHGFIIAASKESKNSFAGSEKAMRAMVADVKSRLPVLLELSFASGMSGGSRMAYFLAELEPTIVGVIACGSGMGVYPDEATQKGFRDAKLRPGLAVCSLMGTNCFNRDEAVRSHNKFHLARSRLTFFPGKHDWAGPPLIADALTFVLGVALKDTPKSPASSVQGSKLPPRPSSLAPVAAPFRDQQLRYSRALWIRTQEPGLPPWEKANWIASLADFPGEPLIKAAAVKATAKLEKDPEVLAGRAADDAVRAFAKKYYSVYDKDKTPKPAREAEAEREAVKFEKLPQAEILRRLGKPQA